MLQSTWEEASIIVKDTETTQVALVDQVSKLMQLILVMPATNASSERVIQCFKSSLRSTMSQERLNYLMLLHVHKDRTDNLCLKTAINEFVQDSQHRSNIFAKYKL